MAGPSSTFEMDRDKRIAENRTRMENLGLFKQRAVLETFRPVNKAGDDAGMVKAKAVKVTTRGRSQVNRWRAQPRRSGRLQPGPDSGDDSSAASEQFVLMEDPEDLLDLMETLAAVESVRCSSKARGRVYDSVVGLCCHFCRQKKLCGEEGCPRCNARDASKWCIGKTRCSKCDNEKRSAFCRACLLIRYGQTMEEAREAMAAGTWLCPHCYEEEHPEEGWICNSSFCMEKRGLKPTGIAIDIARSQGHVSVAHMLQAQLKARGVAMTLRKAAGDEDTHEKPASMSAATITQPGVETTAGATVGPGSPLVGKIAMQTDEAVQLSGRPLRLGGLKRARASTPEDRGEVSVGGQVLEDGGTRPAKDGARRSKRHA